MKRIRVTVTEEYLVPNDWEITKHPHDQISCLHGDNAYFMPALEWAERGLRILPGRSTPSAEWATVDDDRANWFIDQAQESEIEIHEIE